MKIERILLLIITLVIINSAVLYADEIVFEEVEFFEDNLIDEQAVFEDPLNWDEQKSMTENPADFDVDSTFEAYYLTDENDYELDESDDEISADDVDIPYTDEIPCSDEVNLLQNETLSEEQIAEDSTFVNIIDSGTCGENLTWKLTGEEGNMTLTISGIGEMSNYVNLYDDIDGDISPWHKKNSSIVSIILSEGVTSIGNWAFDRCYDLTSVTIPNTVTSIGDYTFFRCNNLSSVIIPDNVTNIGKGAFNECKKLINITIPDSVTSIGDYIFEYCINLTSINISNSVSNIGEGAFHSCVNLTSIEIPDNVTGIGDWAFSECKSLISIKIPNNVTNIGQWTFSGCRNLTSIAIPNTVTNIGDYAFYGCVNLNDIIIPNNVTNIGMLTFYQCSSLTNIRIPSSVTFIGEEAFYGCTNLKSTIIENNVTSIGKSAFFNCSNLIKITIPNSVNNIGNDAFYGCTNLIIYGNAGSYAEVYAEENNIPFKSTLTVLVSDITIDKTEYNLFIDETALIKAIVTPFDAENITLNYKSNDENIVKVDQNGKIEAVNSGETEIVVSAIDDSGISASCKVNVYKKPTANLNTTKETIYTKGDPHIFILIPTVLNGELVSVTYSSSAPKVAYVAKNGKVTGKVAGISTITATVKMKNSAGSVTEKLTCKITVKKPSLIATPMNVSLKKGKTKTLTVKATPKGVITFKSSNKKIATVSKAGKIKAKKKGGCKITVECNGVKKIIKITVK